MTIHEKWMLMSMPKMRAMRIEPGMFSEHKARGGPRAAPHARLVPLVVAVDLASDLSAGLRRRGNVGVRDSCADRGDELVPLTGGDALPGGADDVRRRDGPSRGRSRDARRRLAATAAKERGDPTGDAALAEVDGGEQDTSIEVVEPKRVVNGLVLFVDRRGELTAPGARDGRSLFVADERGLEAALVVGGDDASDGYRQDRESKNREGQDLETHSATSPFSLGPFGIRAVSVRGSKTPILKGHGRLPGRCCETRSARVHGSPVTGGHPHQDPAGGACDRKRKEFPAVALHHPQGSPTPARS